MHPTPQHLRTTLKTGKSHLSKIISCLARPPSLFLPTHPHPLLCVSVRSRACACVSALMCFVGVLRPFHIVQVG